MYHPSAAPSQQEAPPGNAATMRRHGGRRRTRPPSGGGATTSTRRTTTVSANRLYMAPQANIRTRNSTAGGGVDNDDNVLKSGSNNNTRRRRRNSTEPNTAAPPGGGNNNNNTNATHLANSSAHIVDHRHSNHHRTTSSGDRLRVERSPTILLERQDSDGSLGAMAAVLASDRREFPAAPMLWADGEPKMTNRSKKVEQHHMKKKSKHGASRNLHYGHEDYDLEGLDDSFAGCEFSDHGLEAAVITKSSNHSHTSNSKHRATATKTPGGTKRWWNSLWWSFKTSLKDKTESHTSLGSVVGSHCAQLTILLLLIVFVVNSHTKVQHHKNQIQEYDEERSHILEQMMWIDKAAKKVHKKYSDQEMLAKLLLSEEEDAKHSKQANAASLDAEVDVKALKYEEQALQAQQDLHAIQHTIQWNARNHLTSTFGDKPAQVALQIEESASKLLIGLSDDTPHAISTLVQQVDQHVWDDIELQSDADTHSLELRSLSLQHTAPRLEFVERSHGCRDVGSVSLRQEQAPVPQQQGGAQQQVAAPDKNNPGVLVLSVYLSEQSDTSLLPEGSVCIGSVLEGLERLAEWHHRHPPPE